MNIFNMWTAPNQSSRTFACIIYEEHSDGTKIQLQGHMKWNKQHIYKFKDICILTISSFFTMPMLHRYTSTARSWDSFPTDHGGGTSRQLLHASPQQPQKLRLLLPSGQRRRHQQAFPEDYMQYSGRVTNRVPVKADCPNHLGARPMQVKPIQTWRPDLMNISHEHFS